MQLLNNPISPFIIWLRYISIFLLVATKLVNIEANKKLFPVPVCPPMSKCASLSKSNKNGVPSNSLAINNLFSGALTISNLYFPISLLIHFAVNIEVNLIFSNSIIAPK